MGNIINIIRKIILFCVLPISVILFTGIIYMRIDYASTCSNLLRKIKNDSAVSNAEILYDRGTWICKFYIKILFNDGNTLEVRDVNGQGNGIIEISYINDNHCGISKKNGAGGVPSELKMEAWSVITGVEIKNIYDIVANFQLIRECVENWTDLLEYRNDNENLHDAVAKMRKGDVVMVNFISVAGQEYFVYKYSRTVWNEYEKLWRDNFRSKNGNVSNRDVNIAWINFITKCKEIEEEE
jgi:hypothetical protein